MNTVESISLVLQSSQTRNVTVPKRYIPRGTQVGENLTEWVVVGLERVLVISKSFLLPILQRIGYFSSGINHAHTRNRRPSNDTQGTTAPHASGTPPQ